MAQHTEFPTASVDAFVKRYNAHWRLEKLGFQTPLEARQAALRQEAA
jgi:hypothetical protein